MKKCPTCQDGVLKAGQMVHTVEIDSLTVGATIPCEKCDQCDESLGLLSDLDAAELVIAQHCLLQNKHSVSVHRFCRKTLGHTANELAAYYGITGETVKSMEDRQTAILEEHWSILTDLINKAVVALTYAPKVTSSV